MSGCWPWPVCVSFCWCWPVCEPVCGASCVCVWVIVCIFGFGAEKPFVGRAQVSHVYVIFFVLYITLATWTAAICVCNGIDVHSVHDCLWTVSPASNPCGNVNNNNIRLL